MTSPKAVNSGQTEREAFERWITTECNYDPVDMVTQPGGEVYVLAGVQEAWDAWMGSVEARAALTAEKAEPIYQERTVNGFWQDVSKELHDSISAGRVRSEGVRIVYAAPQQPAQPVAWLHEIIEPDGRASAMLSRQSSNPWSFWLEAHRSKCTYRATPLYTAPQPAQPVAQTLALTDEQRHSVDFAAALLEVKGYTGRARDLRSILAAQPASSLAEGDKQ